MRESSTPALVGCESYRNVTELLMRRAAAAPFHTAFEVPFENASPGAPWRQVNTLEYLHEVQKLAKGMMAAGLQPGDAVAIMSPTSYEWALTDLAVWFAGGVVVPIYDSSAASQVADIVSDAGVRLAFGGAATHVELLRRAFTAAEDVGADPALGVWAMKPQSAHDESPDGPSDQPPTPSLEQLAERAADISDEALTERRLLADADSPATIVYTSGTSGEPRGAVLTHGNFLGQVLNIAAAYKEVVHEQGNTIIFLPLAHVLARGLQLVCLASGMRIAHLADPGEVVSTLAVIRPSFIVVVPRVLQKIQAAAGEKANDKKLGALWRLAQETAIEWGRHREEKQWDQTAAAPLSLRIKHTLFDRLFYRRLRQVMGGKVDYVLSGGAALDPELSLFFGGIGVPVIEGYGLTETTAPLTGHLPLDIRSGTVGRPIPGSTVRISDDGEILAKGVGVFSGYRNPAYNTDAFIDGFFRTGDLGRLDDTGRIVLEGRVKDVIVTSTGKTVVPTRWEAEVEAEPIVSHAVMVGEGRQYLSALILLDPEELAATSDLSFQEFTDEAIRQRVQAVVDRANALVSRSEQVRRFTLIVTSLDDPKLVTPTLKLKRTAVLERGARAVEALYA